MMALIICRGNVCGLVLGLELCVGMTKRPSAGAFLTQRQAVPGLTPTYLAALRIDQPLRTKSTVSRRTLGRCGLVVYGIYMNFIAGVAKVLKHYGRLIFSQFRVRV